MYPVCRTDGRLQDSVRQRHSRVWGLEQFTNFHVVPVVVTFARRRARAGVVVHMESLASLVILWVRSCL